MTRVPLSLGARSYAVSLGPGLLASCERLLGALRGRRLVLVSSPRVLALHGARARRALSGLGRVERVVMPDGERFKTARTLARLHDAFAERRLPRDGVVLALGGGVVGDVAGFAAATWMRGVDLVHLPTTLLAVVDSSVGGKVGIDHASGKNLVGAFHQPRAVLADLDLLRTLPPRQWRAGAYEILKCGLIGDPGLLELLARAPAEPWRWDPATLERACAAAVRLKADIVARDEREGGLRRVLNLGHTLAHALEVLTAYRRFTHGEAVGWGLLGAAWIARARGLLSAGDHDALERAVERLGPRPGLDGLAPRDLLRALARDKKVRDGRLAFILPEGLGRVRIVSDVTPDELRAALRALRRGAKGARVSAPSASA